MSNVFDRILLAGIRTTRFAIVHGKSPDYLAFGGKNRRGPTGAEGMCQGQVAKVSPQWIARDVGHNYLFAPVRGSSTGPYGRPDESSVDRLRVSFGKIRRAAVP